MDRPLYSNPISNMDGPSFLVYYLFYGIVLIVVTRVIVNGVGQRKYGISYDDHFSLPSQVDAYYIAWLREGHWYALVLALARSSYLNLLPILNNSAVLRQLNQKNTYKLHPLEKNAIHFYEARDNNRGIILNSIAHQCKSLYWKQALSDGFIHSVFQNIQRRLISWCGFILLIGMGVYKLVMAIKNGHYNIFFLLMMICAYTFIYYFLFFKEKTKPFLTAKGKSFLKYLSSSIPKDSNSLKQVDIAMIVVALATEGVAFSDFTFGQHTDKALQVSRALFFSINHSGDDSGSASNSGDGSGSASNSGGASSSGCGGGGCGGGCGGCGGGGGD